MRDESFTGSTGADTQVTVVDEREAARPPDSQLDGGLLPAGTQVGPYLVLEPVGTGGVGVVYAAYDPRLDRRVALKLLRSARRSTPDARQRLEREARAMAQLDHPNVITVHDVGAFNDEVYLTMAFAEGGTLREWAQGLPTPRTPEAIEQCLERYIRAGRGLSAAHQAGLVHRDFKPDNVLIGRDGQVMVTDFGLVRGSEDTSSVGDQSVDTDTAHGVPERAVPSQPERRSDFGVTDGHPDDLLLTATGSVLGTPAYMSPEQHAGLAVDAASDQFSFCVSLYGALYGERPFRGSSLAALALCVSEGKVADAPRGAKVPERLRRVLLRGLATQPSQRWPDMDSLIDELMRVGLRRGFRAPVWIFGGVVVALCIGIASNLTRAPAPCTGALAAWGETWSSPSREAVRKAFEATALPFASSTFTRVDLRLGDYRKKWLAGFRENCEATLLDGAQSARLMDLRTICLERRRDQVETIASLLSTVEADKVSNADSLLSNLAPVEDCADKAQMLRGSHQLELDSPLARELRPKLDRVALLRLGGSYASAKQEVLASVKRAESAHALRLVGESKLELGRILLATGELDAARQAMDEALIAAIESASAELQGDVWADLVGLVGFSLGESEEAKRYAKLALAAYATHDTADETPTQAVQSGIARVHNGLGLIAYAAGDYDDAEAEFREVLASNEARWGPQHPRTADVLNNLGAIAFARDDLDGSERYHTRCLAIWSKAYDGDHPDIATAYNNLATIHEARGDADAALAGFKDALRIRLATLGPTHPSVAMSHFNIGITLEGKSDYASALPELKRALDGFIGTYGEDHRRVAAAQTAFGRVLVVLDHSAEALPLLEAALQTRTRHDVDPTELAETRYALATALIEQDRQRAIDLARQAHAQYQTHAPDAAQEVATWLSAHSPP